MKRFFRVAITLPLLAAPVVLGLAAVPGRASQEIAPVDALRILAHSRAVNIKCGYQPSANDEFSDYIAKAEVAAARTAGTKPAQAAISNGEKDGKAMACGPAGNELVSAALDASRRAMAQARNQEVPTQPRKRRVALRPAQGLTENDISHSGTSLSREPMSDNVTRGDLRSYSRMAAAYYIERRCRHMNHDQAFRFWQIVVRQHNRLLHKFGPEQVARAKSDAMVMAKSGYRGGCGANTRRIVRERYAGLANAY